MAKSQITPLQLAEKYLIKIGLPKNTVTNLLMPSRFEDYFMCKRQEKSNIVAFNKRGLKGNQTHIAVCKDVWEAFFTPAQTNAYATTRVSCETDQDFIFFEANIENMLSRRANKNSSLIDQGVHPQGTYNAGTTTILAGTGRKWIGEQNHVTQVHLGKNTMDSPIFIDFRLCILRYDYLLFFKEKRSNNVLALAIPSEFVNKYKLTYIKAPKVSATKQKAQQTATTVAHSQYVSSAISGSLTPTYTTGPAPAPAPKKTNGGRPKYIPKPSIGKGAIVRARFICENCGNGTFTSRRTNQNFMEPHHLIPISMQGYYAHDIDITPNLICLCPNCHSKIHYGLKPDIEVMLKAFLAARKTDLKNIGNIDIDEPTLLAYYNI